MFRKSGFLRLEVCGTVHAYSVLGFSWSKNCVCRVIPYSLQDIQAADLLSFYSEDSRSACKQKKADDSLCKIPNHASAVSAKSLLCPIRRRHGVSSPPKAIARPLLMASLLSPAFARQLQHFMSQLLKNSRGWKRSKQHRGFMTSTPGLSWHPVLAAVATYPRLPVCLFQSYFQSASVQGTHNPQISTRTKQLLEGRSAHSYFGISHTQAEPQIKCLVLWTKPIQLVM